MNRRTQAGACLTMAILLLGILRAVTAGRTIYVDDDGPGDFNNIQAATDVAKDGDVRKSGGFAGFLRNPMSTIRSLPTSIRMVTVRFLKSK